MSGTGSAADEGAVEGTPDPFRRTALVSAAALVLALAVTALFTAAIARRFDPTPVAILYVSIRLLVATFNTVLLVVLLVGYVRVYRNLPNSFTLSLLAMTVALLLYSVTTNPIVHWLLDLQGSGLGPFTFLPDLFAGVAILILLYQSYK